MHDHMACKTGQLGLYLDIYQHIYILNLVELSSFLPRLFLKHVCKVETHSWSQPCGGSEPGRAAGLGLPARHEHLSCTFLLSAEETQCFVAQALKVLSLCLCPYLKRNVELMLTLRLNKVVFYFARLSGGGQRAQSRALYFCLETGHLCNC